MTETAPDDWSPADHPYAIAFSEAQWWKNAVMLTVARIRDDHHPPVSGCSFSSRQIDARFLVVALRQLLTAAEFERTALEELGIDGAVGAELHQAQQRFDDALPGIKHMRDGLVHFEDWSRGLGKYGPQRQLKEAGEEPRDIARKFSGFGYDPGRGTIFFGLADPGDGRLNRYTIDIDKVEAAAEALTWAIYLAAGEVDKTNRAAQAPGASEH